MVMLGRRSYWSQVEIAAGGSYVASLGPFPAGTAVRGLVIYLNHRDEWRPTQFADREFIAGAAAAQSPAYTQQFRFSALQASWSSNEVRFDDPTSVLNGSRSNPIFKSSTLSQGSPQLSFPIGPAVHTIPLDVEVDPYRYLNLYFTNPSQSSPEETTALIGYVAVWVEPVDKGTLPGAKSFAG